MGCCNKKCGLIACCIVGAILVILGGISVTVFDIFFEQIVIQEGVIAEGTIMYDAWSVVTTPTYLSYYFYNVTNPEEFLAQTPDKYVPPVLEELGPYTFREYLEKDRIDFRSDLDPEEVYYRQKTILYFEPELSSGSLDDPITTINIIGASLGAILDYQAKIRDFTISPLIYRRVNKLYKEAGTELLFTKSAHDILFGFEDELYTSVVDLFAGLNITIPPTFGLFSTSNVSEGWFDYQVYTGKKRPDLINLITRYRNMSELDYWNSTECNMINGTDGTSTPPFMVQEDKIYFFIDDVCRSLFATFDEEVTVKNVPAWKYSVPPEIFQSPIKNPDNKCYCSDPNDVLCEHDGAILIESCQAGAPILISSPHFLNGDGYYLNQTEGVTPPVKEEHEAALVYEPFTGTAIKVDKRLQVNILLKPNENIDILNVIQDKIAFPVVWLNESAEVGQEDADLLYGLLVVPAEVVFILQIILCIVGGIMFVAPIIYGILAKNTKDKSSKIAKEYSYSKSNSELRENGGHDNESFKKL